VIHEPTGEVLFNYKYPALAPDVILSHEDEQIKFDPNIDHLKSLVNWDPGEPQSLSGLLEELLMEYRHHHSSLLHHHQRLHFEYSTLKENYPNYQIDIHCTPSDKSEPIARFYVTIEVDFSPLPAYVTKDNPGSDFVALTVVFYPPNASKVETSLYFSSHVERILGSAAKINLPVWNMDTYLMDYVPAVHSILKEKVDLIVESYVKRKEYFAALLNHLGQSILEYDTESFKKISFLFEHQGFCFIAHLSLSEMFPSEAPVLSFYSVYHKFGGRPFEFIIDSIPNSVSWDTEEKTMRLKNCIFNAIPKFKELSKQNGEFL
jgi:BRCA1-A complex subunit BRE